MENSPTYRLVATDRASSVVYSVSHQYSSWNIFAPYGSCSLTSIRKSTVIGFNGERPDPLTAATHLGNGFRAFDPVIMRFTCPDSSSPFSGGGINPYVYCGADPINFVDPSGHVILGVLTVERVLRSLRILGRVDESLSTEATAARPMRTYRRVNECDQSAPTATTLVDSADSEGYLTPIQKSEKLSGTHLLSTSNEYENINDKTLVQAQESTSDLIQRARAEMDAANTAARLNGEDLYENMQRRGRLTRSDAFHQTDRADVERRKPRPNPGRAQNASRSNPLPPRRFLNSPLPEIPRATHLVPPNYPHYANLPLDQDKEFDVPIENFYSRIRSQLFQSVDDLRVLEDEVNLPMNRRHSWSID